MSLEVEKYMKLYEQYHTVVLLDELCSLSISSGRKFSFDICNRIDVLKELILYRTGHCAGVDNFNER